jgi:hypothetical protein
MGFSYESSHGTTFLFNKDLAGNVTIIRGTAQMSVPGADLLEFVKGPEKGTGGAPYKKTGKSAASPDQNPA